MSQNQEFEKAMQNAWSILTVTRKKWSLIGVAFLSLIVTYPAMAWAFKFEISLTGWGVVALIATIGRYFAFHKIQLAEERYFGEFPALIPEDD